MRRHHFVKFLLLACAMASAGLFNNARAVGGQSRLANLAGANYSSDQQTSIANTVLPIDWNRLAVSTHQTELEQTVKATLLNANKFALTTWYRDIKKFQVDSTGYLELKSKGDKNEKRYRFPASMAFGLAISLKTGIYRPEVTGVSREEARAKAIQMICAVAFDHKANGTRQVWGGDWQAAHWTYYAGYAAWLLWDDIAENDRNLLLKMITSEADRFLTMEPPFYKDRAGKLLIPGDSKIEENAWNAELIYLAAVMLPNHPHSGQWLHKAVEYMVSATTLPFDVTSSRVIHGRPISSWIEGYNVEPPGFVINHGIIHPMYNAIPVMVNAPIVFSLAGRATPEAARFNLDKIYYSITSHRFTAPPYRQPGGSMYVEGSAEVYYPEGSDWGQGVYDTYANLDIAAFSYGWDNLSTAHKGEYWAKLHAEKVLEQQKRFVDGHTYLGDSENSYPGREEAIATRMGSAWMTLWLQRRAPASFDNQALD